MRNLPATSLLTPSLLTPSLLTLALAVVSIPGAAAQTAPNGVLTPAPVPSRGPTEVAPSDRVGRADGSERAAPFSGLPNTLDASRGQSTPTTTGESSRDGAPAPSLSR